MSKQTAREIAYELMTTYSYYDTVYFAFIVEAVENTIKDHGGNIPSLKAIHNHITENYI